MKCLETAFQNNTSKVALVSADTGDVFSFTDLLHHRDNLLQIFPRKQGNLIFIQSQNTYRSVATVLSLLSSNNTICLLDPSMTSRTLEKYRTTFSPDIIISDQSVNNSIPGYFSTPHPYSEELKILCKESDLSRQLPLQLRLILPTSGSTGSLKFVKLAEENLTINGQDICNAMQISSNDRAYAHLPFHYSYGLSVLISHALAGATSVVTSASIMEKKFWQEMRHHKCNFFPGVPFHFQTLLRFGVERLRIPDVTRFSVAGGTLDGAHQEQFLKQLSADSDFYIMYGQTEASPRISTFNLRKYAKKLGSVGQVIGSSKISIEPNQGEILLSGPNVMQGYATERNDLYLPDQMNARLSTGDLGYLDEEGFLYITGRLKRIAKLYGLRLNLDDMENHLSTLCPCIVIEKENSLHIATDQSHKTDQLKAAFNKAYQIPGGHVKFHKLDHLPRLTSGKLDYQTLSEMI